MGFRIRKSIRLAPGVRMTFSKSGIGYSFGVKGYRVTHRADGRIQRTASIPGTGLSYVTTSGGGGRHASQAAASHAAPVRRSPPPAPPVPRPLKPALLAPKGEKELYHALETRDAAAMERVAQEHPDVALAAETLAGALELSAGDNTRAKTVLEWVFATGRDPAADAFLRKYVSFELQLHVATGVTASLPLARDTIGLALAELEQATGDVARAIDVVEQLEPTTYTALSLAELYTVAGRYDEVVSLTDGIANQDDATALLCVFRGIALREQGHLDAACDAFREALKSKRRAPVIRHRAWLERARAYEADGKRAMAKRDLEHILAEDADYDGLAEELAKLG